MFQSFFPHAMQYEVEQKFPVADFDNVEQRLLQLGAQFEATITQVDRYLAHPARDFAVTDEAFRIRSVGEKNLVTYKGPKIDATTKTRHEIELPLHNGRDLAERYIELLAALGFQLVAAVRKIRRTAHFRSNQYDVEVSLDRVEDVGTFVEIEIVADESELGMAKACLADIAQQIGLSNTERRSYLELLLDGLSTSELGRSL